ncbi:hypothetical protein FAI40_04835 [Acetobacteraceae bacterium]|nr:hypothetical protein FAI40_04835 [Acetobacteraceae bacterium]
MSVDDDRRTHLQKAEEIEIARQAYIHQEDIREYEREMLDLKRKQVDAMERAIYWQRLHMWALLTVAFVLFLWMGFVLVKFMPSASF